MITRHLIFLRVPIFRKFLSFNLVQKNITIPLKQIPLDLRLYSISMLSCVVIAAIIGEYLLRHFLHVNSLVVYEYYPYIMQAFTIATLLFIANYIVKSVFKIKA